STRLEQRAMTVVVPVIVVLLLLVIAGAVVLVRRRGRTVRGPAVREAETDRPAPREPEATAPAVAPTEVRFPVRESLGTRIRGLFSGGVPTGDEWPRLED